jgi:hypothetical protein
LENARKAMIRAHKASDKPHVYMPKYIGPLLVVSASDKVVQVQLPASYSQVHDN